MKSLYLNPETNDLVITDKMGLETVSGVDEAAQHLRILLTTRLGEWFLNTQYGFEYDAILGEKYYPAISDIRSAILDAVSRDSRNITINTVDLEYNEHTRALLINLVASVNDDTFEMEITI